MSEPCVKTYNPTGLPVLIHTQLSGDCLETAIGLVTGIEDATCMAENYRGRIRAVIVTGGDTLRAVSGLEHISKRISACYWVYLGESELMRGDFKGSWNGKSVSNRIDNLLTTVKQAS